MVMPAWATRGIQRGLRAIRNDISGLATALRFHPASRPGLFTYHVNPPGGSRIIHLRIDRDGRAVLLVDVSDTVHLNETAATLAKMALDERTPEQAAIALRRRGLPQKHINAHVRSVYALVAHLASTTDPCLTCGLATADRTDLFSMPVHAPYKADLALTYGCNNACGHCYNERGRASSRALALEQWKQVIDRLHAIGVPHVIFTGGEPTLHPHLTELIAHARALGIVTGVNSNGRRFTDPKFTRDVSGAGLNHLQVTLQSHRPEVHDAMTGAESFAETVAGIRNALQSGLHTITNTTLTRTNSDEAERVVEFLHGLGLSTFAMNGMIHSGSGRGSPHAITEDRLAPVLVAVRDRAAELKMRFLWYTPTPYCRLSPVELDLGAKRCNAAEYTMAVEPDGSVLPCQSYYQRAGNILHDEWSEIWNSPLFRSFRGRVENLEGSKLPKDCWDCPDLPLCAGGCRIAWEAEAAHRVPVVSGALRSNA